MPVSSLYPEVNLVDQDLYSFIFKRDGIPFSKDKVIYQDSENPKRRYTYGDVAHLSSQFGRALKSTFNIQKDDVVALFTPNDVDYPVVVFGSISAGAIVSPANPGYTVPELSYQLKDAGAKVVIAHWAVIDTVRKACENVNIPSDHILILGSQHDPSGKLRHWTTLESKANSGSSSLLKIDAKSDIAFLAYSSGTTGRPKGVMLTHRNMTSNVLQITACEAGKLSHDGRKRTPNIPDAPVPQGDKILSCLPFFHIYGLTSLVLAPIRNGITTILLPRFDIVRFCSLVQEHRITFIYIVPPMALLLAKHPDVPKYDLSSIRITNSGAAPLTRELQEAVFKRCGVRIKQGYGLSETSPTSHEQRFEDWNKKIGTIGRLMPNMQAKFCAIAAPDETPDTHAPQELPVGQIGELYMKGPNVFKGYWHNAAATRECLTEDGWFRTGDVGFVDEEGDFWITDRVKELIKYKGFQVPPAELEGYLIDHELVDDVAVVGVDSEVLGTEIPRAYIVRKGGLSAVRDTDAETIIDWLNGRVANHKKLRGGIKFVDAVPKSPSGKLLRRLLKDRAKAEFAAEEKQTLKAKL